MSADSVAHASRPRLQMAAPSSSASCVFAQEADHGSSHGIHSSWVCETSRFGTPAASHCSVAARVVDVGVPTVGALWTFACRAFRCSASGWGVHGA